MNLLLSSAALSLLAALTVWMAGRRDPARSPLLTTGCLLTLLALPLLAQLPKIQLELPAVAVPGGGAAPALSSVSGLALFWLLGFLVFSLRLLADLRALARWRERAVELADPEVLELLEECRHQLGVRGAVGIREHPETGSPFIAGLFQPVIYLPECHRDWSEETLRMVLLHELGHVSRRDLWRSHTARVACLLHWFNPLVWWLRSRLMAQCEFACDAKVIEVGADPAGYAHALCDVAEAGPAPRAALAMASRATLRQRVERLVLGQRAKGSLLIGAALLLTVTASLALSVVRFASPSLTAEATPDAIYTPEEIEIRLTADPFPAD